MRLVAYLRVSTNGQVDRFGLPAQREEIAAWAAEHGHEIVAEREDGGVSGTVEALDRPGMLDAFSWLESGKAEGLVIARLDRLARTLTIQEAALVKVWAVGGHVFAADVGEIPQDDPDDPMRTFIRQVFGAVAQLDRAMTIKRMRDGRKAKRAIGGKAEGSYPFGWRKGTRPGERVPDEREQRVINVMRELRADGCTWRDVAARLNESGEECSPRKRDGIWHTATVNNIGRREGIA